MYLKQYLALLTKHDLPVYSFPLLNTEKKPKAIEFLQNTYKCQVSVSYSEGITVLRCENIDPCVPDVDIYVALMTHLGGQ